MATEKVSATIDEGLLAAVRARVGPRGLSAFLNEAVRHELQRAALRELLDEIQADIGPPDETMVGEADALLGSLVKAKPKAPKRTKG